jgi:hypothetical protein
MGSKRRLRRKECEGKRRYATAGEASAAVNAARGSAAGGQYLEAYQCPHCGGWHIGHKPGSMREHTDLYGEFLRRERW